jgi:hypothetical protein
MSGPTGASHPHPIALQVGRDLWACLGRVGSACDSTFRHYLGTDRRFRTRAAAVSPQRLCYGVHSCRSTPRMVPTSHQVWCSSSILDRVGRPLRHARHSK